MSVVETQTRIRNCKQTKCQAKCFEVQCSTFVTMLYTVDYFAEVADAIILSDNFLVYNDFFWRFGVVIALVVVTLHRARLVLGLVTDFGRICHLGM